MTVYAQHGHGKSTKLTDALERELISGIIYSPRNEMPDRLIDAITSISVRYSEAIQFIDPQFYAALVQEGNVGKLGEYDYFQPELTYRDVRGGSQIVNFVTQTLDFQISTRVTHLCSPTVAIASLNDRWTALATSFAEESIAYHRRVSDDRPLLVSWVIHEHALKSESQVNEFLDIITSLECDGFYLTIDHDQSAFTQDCAPDALAGLLYMVYVLSELNDIPVIVGYSDFVALALHAAGASATACGWNSGERRFSMSRFEPRGGGRRPNARYSSAPLLNSILVTPEMDTIYRLGRIREIVSRTEFDAEFLNRIPSSVHWLERLSALHHWEVLHDLVEGLTGVRSVRRRLDMVQSLIQNAIGLYGRIAQVPFSAQSGPNHLQRWLDGLREFRTRAGI